MEKGHVEIRRGFAWIKIFKKRILKDSKAILRLTKTHYQIDMTSEYSVSGNVWFKSYLSAEKLDKVCEVR